MGIVSLFSFLGAEKHSQLGDLSPLAKGKLLSYTWRKNKVLPTLSDIIN